MCIKCCKRIQNTTETVAYLEFPLRAAWWIALKPLLFVKDISTPASIINATISSLFFVIASCNAVSPSESCKLWCAPASRSDFTLFKLPLFTATCNAVCRLLLRAFKSEFASCKISMMEATKRKEFAEGMEHTNMIGPKIIWTSYDQFW